jgi:hypothetical protein
MNLVRVFERDGSGLSRLNYALITLIPKEEGARSLKKFRPISLINCSFKFFLQKLLTIDWLVYVIDCCMLTKLPL